MYTPRDVQEQLDLHASAPNVAGEWRKAATHPPLFGPGAIWGFGRGPYREIHRWYNRLVWQRYKSPERRGELLRRVVRWPVLLSQQSLKATKKHGNRVRKLTGKSKRRQRLEQLYLGLVYSIPPKSYYLFRLFESGKRARASHYIHRFETKVALFGLVNRNLGNPIGSELLGDKTAFTERCRERDLPTPTLYFEVEDGAVVPHELNGEYFPEVDLIVKQRIGRGGHVIMRWEYRGEERYCDADGVELKGSELLEQLKKESIGIPFMVSKRMVNHPDILDFAGPGGKILTTCRLITAFDEQGEPEVLSGTFKIAINQSVADNVHFGGVASPVDIATGELGAAISTGPLGERVEVHPLSGTRIAGAKLPMWEETLDLVKRAHHGFSETIFIGWDVGITPEGPVLVEGNTGLCVHLNQTPQGEPLGDGRFGELLAFHLARIDPKNATYLMDPVELEEAYEA